MPSLVKEMMMKEMTNAFKSNPYAFISNFQGLPVADLSDLRRSLNKCAKRSLLMKHSMAKKIFSSLQLSDAEKFLKDNVLITLADKEPQAVSKALFDFAKANQKLVPAGVVFENKVYDGRYVKQLAQLPSRHELLTQLVIRVKSPISGFVLTLSQLLRGLAVAVNEIKKKKEVATA